MLPIRVIRNVRMVSIRIVLRSYVRIVMLTVQRVKGRQHSVPHVIRQASTNT